MASTRRRQLPDMKLACTFSQMLPCIYMLLVQRLLDTLSPEQDSYTVKNDSLAHRGCPLRTPDMEVADVELPGLTNFCSFGIPPSMVGWLGGRGVLNEISSCLDS